MTFDRDWERKEVGGYGPGISRQVTTIERENKRINEMRLCGAVMRDDVGRRIHNQGSLLCS